MLTGQPAFGGEDITITLARVVDRDTDLQSLPATISPAVRHTIQLCLQKDVRKRVADIRDVRLALEGAFESHAVQATDVQSERPSILRRSIPIAAALMAGGILVGLAGLSLWPETEPRRVNRFTYSLPEGQSFSATNVQVIDISPDGRAIVYHGSSGLRLRDMESLEDRPISSTDAVTVQPTFSPGFIKRIATTGGASVVIANWSGSGAPSLSWGFDGTILYTADAGIMRVAATGGTPELIVPTEVDIPFGPRLLPSGDAVLYTTFQAGTLASGQVVVQSLSTGERTVIAGGANDGRYLPTGHVVYAFEDSLFGIGFDAQENRATGGAVPLVQGVSRATGGNASAHFAVANEGTLVYVRGLSAGAGARTLVWGERDGVEEPIGVPPRSYSYLELSPDETRVSLDIRDQENDTWVWDLERETLQRLTFDPSQNRGAIWSPDGRRIAFSRQLDDSEEIYWQAADGSGASEALTDGSGMPMFPVEITPDGTTLLYTKSNLPRDIFMIPVAGPAGAGTPLLTGAASEGSPTVSPDGRWLAYSSNESGNYEVYVRPFPEVDTGRWQISSAGGIHPQWSRDGSELFYLLVEGSSVTMMAVSVETETSFRPGTPAALFEGPYYFGATAAGPDVYDVSSDGQRFMMISEEQISEDTGVAPDIVVVQNWFEELNRLVPTQ